jgi:hypothetical protein
LSKRLDDPAEESIADLFHQLVDEGGKVVKAEVNLYKEIARHRAAKARNGLIALVAGGVLAFDALIVLLIMLAQGLAVQTGPVVSGLIVATLLAIPAYLLVRFGSERLGALGGDEEEQAALRAAEHRP